MMDSDTAKNDFEYSREMYYKLLQKGEAALEELVDFAEMNPHPRTYEVLSGMIKNISDVNDRLMDLHKKRKELTAKSPTALPAPEQGTTNVFVGSTEELQKMIKQQQEKNMVDVTPKDDSGE
jgi:hypothetical protein